MDSFMVNMRKGFGRPITKSPHTENDLKKRQQTPSSSQTGSSNLMPPSSPGSASSPSSTNMPGHEVVMDGQAWPTSGTPFFFREAYSGLIVKGNFLTLVARPPHVEEGEWLAHQVVEQVRLLNLMTGIIRAINQETGLPICNPEVCPSMSAYKHTYYWLDSQKRPIQIPACQFIILVGKWIDGKIKDPALFPTEQVPLTPAISDTMSAGVTTPTTSTGSKASMSTPETRNWLGKTSGFPEQFHADIKNIFRQMMRCYAHLYYGHWIEPFWHIGCYKELNTCFIYFIAVARLYRLLGDREMEPMQPLIDMWLATGLLPDTKAPDCLDDPV